MNNCFSLYCTEGMVNGQMAAKMETMKTSVVDEDEVGE
jgi:hypothetical protein